jgi:stage II sporulation protein D
VICVKKQILHAILAGAVVPLMMAALFQRIPRPEVTESTPTTTYPAVQTMLTVLDLDGTAREMALTDYLTGVVLAEMPADFEPEALKAQAVVARTYTRRRMDGGKHSAAAVCMDAGCCQGFREPEEYLASGGTQEALDKIRRAVMDTEGLVLCYNGALIDATYFSCSGGSTEDAVAVWGRDVPYLQAVQSPGEEEAPRYSDTVTFTPAEFAEKLGLSSDGDPARWFGEVRSTDGGGVDTMVIQGQEFRGTQLRSKLGLRSTAMEITVEGGTITVATRGFGHRVGMSQYGAQAMAKNGSSFEAILAHYYTGTELVRE